ncbi:MAG TPA: signal peptidase I [Chloroflexota bacterium]|nr:signal peptidase I [Chloroflexota bacterium]
MIDSPLEPPSDRTAKVVREIVETIILTVLIFFVVRLVVQNFRVDGISMFPTVKNGDLVLVNKADYLIGSPGRGDVIVFHPPIAPKEDYIKRVIGIPGDVVRIRVNQGVWINGHKVPEPYIPASQIPDYNWGPEKVPKNDYFVLGDNRNQSYDSHAWINDATQKPDPWVPRSAIIGKALIAYWPFGDMKFFNF